MYDICIVLFLIFQPPFHCPKFALGFPWWCSGANDEKVAKWAMREDVQSEKKQWKLISVHFYQQFLTLLGCTALFWVHIRLLFSWMKHLCFFPFSKVSILHLIWWCPLEMRRISGKICIYIKYIYLFEI